MNTIDLVGERFGKLNVIERAGSRRSKALWLCSCECGETRVVPGDSLRTGRAKSCGCLRRRNTSAMFTRHGMSESTENRIWRSMLARCGNPNNPAYRHYGGRGIKVCDRWTSFENFYADMGPRPSLEHTLDRIENNQGYGPDNCRWATRKEQARNRRSTLRITIDGITKPFSEWAEILGLDYFRFYDALRGQGWENTNA